MSSLDYIDLCRLCLVKDHVNVPIFEGEGDVRQIFLKIAACLPVKVAREDKLPKKICDDCVYKVESFYQFWNTTASAEKQLFQWIGEDNLEDKQGYVNVMKQEQNSENRFGSNVIQVAGNQNNMDIRLMDNMGLGMPIIISSSNQQQIPSVPLDSADNSVTQVQAVPSSSSHEQMSQSQTNIATQEEDDDESDDDNMDDECDGDEGLSVKEEGEDELNSNKNIESSTFVNVGMTCDQAGPSGLQQQKITEMTDIGLQQTTDEDPKSGYDQAESRDQKQEIKEENEKGPSKESSEPNIVPKQESEAEDVKKKKNACTQCNRVFRTAVSLRKHMKKHTGRKGQSPKGEKNEQEFMCKTCDKVFRHKSNYQKHLLRHTVGDLTCKHCPKKFRLFRDLTRHEKTHFFPSYMCKECDYETTVVAALSIHMLRHTDKSELPFKCTECEKRFRKAIDLQEHYNIHSGEKPFDCQICGSAFCLRRQLSAHCRRVHPEIKANKITSTACDICGRVLATKRSLFRHKESHNPTKLYLCDFCGKSLSSAEHLKKHRRIHTGEKPYVCDICGKGFTDSENLRMHRRVHTGEKPYKCDQCPKAFSQRSTLTIHKRGHTGERPYVCQICNRGFSCQGNLTAHQKSTCV